jgi:hypothetical protein
MSSLSKGLNNRLKAEPRQFCKIEKIFVYASGFQLRNKVLAQVERGSSRLQFFFNYLKLLDKGMVFWVVVHEEYRKPPFFWRRPWIEISSADHFSCNFNANVSIPYSIKAVTKRII